MLLLHRTLAVQSGARTLCQCQCTATDLQCQHANAPARVVLKLFNRCKRPLIDRTSSLQAACKPSAGPSDQPAHACKPFDARGQRQHNRQKWFKQLRQSNRCKADCTRLNHTLRCVVCTSIGIYPHTRAGQSMLGCSKGHVFFKTGVMQSFKPIGV